MLLVTTLAGKTTGGFSKPSHQNASLRLVQP
jgi:hypothetical protein